ncbi:hypothetical protein R70006_06205 [Paraburkholderia domus]|nr:hypothetical protein R70006_06205 [Paraburkholderia domus]
MSRSEAAALTTDVAIEPVPAMDRGAPIVIPTAEEHPVPGMALVLAIREGDGEAVDRALARGALPGFMDWLPIKLAVEFGASQRLERLLAIAMPPNAVLLGCVNQVMGRGRAELGALLATGVDLGELHPWFFVEAVWRGDAEKFQMLLDHGLTLPTDPGAGAGVSFERMVGPIAYARDAHGPLWLALQQGMIRNQQALNAVLRAAAYKNWLDVARLALTQGADASDRDQELLRAALWYKHFEMAALLETYGADLPMAELWLPNRAAATQKEMYLEHRRELAPEMIDGVLRRPVIWAP